jgi:hypothetical protein
MMGSNVLPRFDREASMFRPGRTFQPMSSGGLGQIRLHTPADRPDIFGRRAFVGQAYPQPTQQPPAAAPLPAPDRDQDKGQGVQRRPAIRIAWGRLKKMDAEQLSELLTQILERMKVKGIPPGMVAKIQARLADFNLNAPSTAEVEITEAEVKQMDEQLLALETAEAQDSSDGVKPWIIATGAAIGLGLLIDWLAG